MTECEKYYIAIDKLYNIIGIYDSSRNKVIIREIETKKERTKRPLNQVIRTTLGINIEDLDILFFCWVYKT
jgi:hypothetical protein